MPATSYRRLRPGCRAAEERMGKVPNEDDRPALRFQGGRDAKHSRARSLAKVCGEFCIVSSSSPSSYCTIATFSSRVIVGRPPFPQSGNRRALSPAHAPRRMALLFCSSASAPSRSRRISTEPPVANGAVFEGLVLVGAIRRQPAR